MNAKLLIIQSVFLKYLVLIFIASNCVLGNAQEFTSQAAFAEKVYLQLDRNVYRQGETLWFKAIVAQAKDNVPSTLSGVLHVELIDSFEELVSKKTIQLDKGIGANFFDLREDLPSGIYKIRAYTQWNQNFETDFMFHAYINILDPLFETAKQEIVKVIENPGDTDNVRFIFNPKYLDSLAGDKFELEIAFDENKDSYTIRKNKQGNFLLEEEFPEGVGSINLKIYTENGKQWNETLKLSEPAIDIQFMPEGGNFISNINNLIAFKAVNNKGEGIPITGEIIGTSGETVTKFKSNPLGMGRVYLFPDEEENYQVRLTDSLSTQKITYRFPEIKQTGSTISINDIGEKLAVAIRSTAIQNDSIQIQLSSRGIELGKLTKSLENGKTTLILPKTILPQGIIVLTLMTSDYKPLAERLFFNVKKEEAFDIKLTLNKKFFATREAVELNLNQILTPSDSTSTSASIVVIPENLADNMESPTINSYLLLSSELKGKIEKPAIYFSETNENRNKDLDNLMLTQGWRSYKFTETLKDNLEYTPEVSLNVEGEISALLNENKPKEGVDVSLMVFGDETSFFDQKTDSLGRFYFAIPPLKRERIRTVLQTKNEKGKVRNYTIELKKNDKLDVFFDQNLLLFKQQTDKASKLNNELIVKEEKQFFYYDPNINQLDEVLLSNYEITPQRQKVLVTYGKPDVVIDGKKIEAKDNKNSRGLFDILRQSFGDKISFVQAVDSIGVRYQKPVIAAGFPTLVLVDGIPVLNHEYNLLPTLPPTEIKSVEILETVAKNFQQLYRRINFINDGATPVMGSILAIYTYSGNGIYTAYKSKGILKKTISGFAVEKEFYALTYETDEPASDITDDRITIYWNPTVTLKGNEPINLSFYNGDIPGTKTIIIEAISQDGKLGFKTVDYEVEE